MPPRSVRSPIQLAQKAARARFESTALARVPTWGNSHRVKRPKEIRKAQDTQVRALLATLPPEKRKTFLSAYREEVRTRIRSLELVERVFNQHKKDLAAATTRGDYAREYGQMHRDMRKVVGQGEARFILTELEKSGSLIPVASFGRTGVIRNLHEAVEVVEANKGVVINVLKRFTSNRRNQQEILENIYTEICERMLSLKPGDNVRNILSIVTKRAIQDYLRREGGVRTVMRGGKKQELVAITARVRRKSISIEQMADMLRLKGKEGRIVGLVEPADPRPAKRQDQIEWRQALLAGIRGLPEKQQNILTMYYFEGLTFKEIGKHLGFSETYTVKQEKLALKRLRELLAKYFR